MRPLLFCLAAAVLLAPGCKKPVQQDDGADFLSEPERRAPAGPAIFERTGEMLPRDREVPGWRLVEGPSYYDTSTLFEVINGASPGYLAYGFKEMAKADYKPEGIDYAEDMVIEVYQMTSDLGAYGKFSEERSSCDPPGKDPGPGCSRGSDRVFHAGRYFVKVTTYDDSDKAVTQLRAMAAAIAKRIPGDAKIPAEVAMLPTTGMKPNSVVYRPKDLLGISALGAGFQADYDIDGDEHALFYQRYVDEAAAREAVGRIRSAALTAGFAKEGAKIERVADLGDDAITVETGYGWMVAVRKGAQLVGVVEADRKDKAISRAAVMLTGGAITAQ